jgi:cytochrome c oxidase cbb3-type subunit 2
MNEKKRWKYFLKSEKSLVLTVVSILVLFGLAIGVVVIAPSYVDDSWIEPCCSYQVQMHEVSDPHFYINAASLQPEPLEFVKHLKEGESLITFEEKQYFRIVAPDHLKKYITAYNEKPLKITTKLLFLREPQKTDDFDALAEADLLKETLAKDWEEKNPDWEDNEEELPFWDVKELFDPALKEGFAFITGDEIFEPWVDDEFYVIDPNKSNPNHYYSGVIYTQNPQEYLIRYFHNGTFGRWQYSQEGNRIENLKELESSKLGFVSRKRLINMGENIYKKEGCFYCHTDQTRTLVEDCVLNGTPFYPAPPSSANEYIYQETTFPGTKRNGPDISRVGIKKQSRDWHKSHFWSPRSKSQGSIMPPFKHFFDEDPDDVTVLKRRVPNCQFEAIYQYLMTKGTRITSPNQAWWEGKDPMNTIEIIGSKGDKKRNERLK